MRVQQTATQALDVLRQAEAAGRSVTVNKRGEVAFAGRVATLVENIRGKFNSVEWKSTREVERHQRVLDAFGTALSRDFHPEAGNARLAKAYEGVVKHISYTFKDDYRQGVLPAANRIAGEIAASLNEALGKFDKRQNNLADRAVTEFVNGTPPAKTQALLDDIARGIHVGGGDGRVELDMLCKALEARTERLGDAYAKAESPTDAQAQELRDHARALAYLTNAIETAVAASRQADQSHVPRFDGGGIREKVTFAGVDNNANRVGEALGGEEIRELRRSKSGKDLQSLFARGLDHTESAAYAQSQPLAEGTGLMGNQTRGKSEIVAANRLWATYDTDEGIVDTRSVSQIADEEVSNAEANVFRTRLEKKQDAQRAALEAQAAGKPAEAQKPLPSDTWIIHAYKKDSPIMEAIKSSPLKDNFDVRGSIINAYTNRLVQESDGNRERQLIGFTPDEVKVFAQAAVEKFLPKTAE